MIETINKRIGMFISSIDGINKDSAQIIEGEEITAKLAKGSFEAKVGKKNV